MPSQGEEPSPSSHARTDSTLFSDSLVVRFTPTGSSAAAEFSVSLLTLPALTTTWTQYTVDLPTFGIATDTRIAFEYSVTNALYADFFCMETRPVNPRQERPLAFA